MASSQTEHFDVVIVGAGISGIGSACHLSQQCPDKSFVVLEALESFGGTWLVHKFPGIRSDSDLFTYGYRFKPWTSVPIATGEAILGYMGEVIEENDLARHIRYRHRITGASWSSRDNEWDIEVARGDTGERLYFTAHFLWMCQGYYRHDGGYTPQWPGMERYEGRVVHPQNWPIDLDYADRDVLVIGSGATMATIVPTMAPDCAHITVLQRSPTYFLPLVNRAQLAETLREIDVPEDWIYTIMRKKSVHDQEILVRLAREEPEITRTELINGIRQYLPEGFDVDKDFTPRYRPWQQRLALVPDGDLFKAIAAGKVSFVTDEITTFTEKGVALKSGDELAADIIVTATGFDLSVLGDIPFVIDGAPLDAAAGVTYRGIMFTGVPNLAWVFGYFRVSWTLRSDLVGDFVCRLVSHMDDLGAKRVTPVLRPEDVDAPRLPWFDPEDMNPGYLMRSAHLLPKRLDKPEWRHTQDYWRERDDLATADLDDGCLRFE
ncbi:MAG TPA: NAD(P)/FAD-dependent oxidoreductase [Acidimicrobiales bacterium]|nr:NAD(P)/FAD-dependent oxidoreductase [Acidimicrobiales bacterium]